MNANELADEFKNRDWDEVDAVLWCEKAATMLRQQQAEIEALKLQLHTTLTNRDLRTYDGKLDMNNEPVAWMDKRTNKCVVFINTPPSDDWIPLYTHPADLTDEEITEVLNDENIAEYHQGNWLVLPYAFARAILRKASE
jgi:hypothetical protein